MLNLLGPGRSSSVPTDRSLIAVLNSLLLTAFEFIHQLCLVQQTLGNTGLSQCQYLSYINTNVLLTFQEYLFETSILPHCTFPFFSTTIFFAESFHDLHLFRFKGMKNVAVVGSVVIKAFFKIFH